MILNIKMNTITRNQIIQYFVKQHTYKTYLEIGCADNKTFDHVTCPFKIGVDPVRGGNIRLTSNEFFKFNTQKFDLIFIDGLHHYDQVSLDFANSLDCLNENGTIVIHDMLPNNELEQTIPYNSSVHGAWTGDVWRLGFDLIRRNDILFKIYSEDYGVGVVTKKKQNPVLIEKSIKTWADYLTYRNKLPIVSFANEHKNYSS